jgi:hypothetical protein
LWRRVPLRRREFSAETGGTQKENIVHNLHIDHAMQNRVMAVFESSAAVFELPQAATLEDLAGRLAHLSEGHDGTLISVDVRVGPRRSQRESSLNAPGGGWAR